jgi:hypothetical protein
VFPLATLELSITLSPVQKVVGPFAEIIGAAGVGLAVIVIKPFAEIQPFPSVTLTVYVPGDETEIVEVVALVDHKFPDAELDVRVTLCPEQIAVCGAEMVGVVGNGFTVTVVAVEVEEQPTEPTVTV